MNEKFFTLSPEKQLVFSVEKRVNIPPERRGIGVVFQDYAVWPHLSVWDNVCYPMKKHKVPKDEIPKRAAYALEQVRGQVLRQKLDGVTDFFELMHIGARAKLELLTRCPYLLEFSIRAFYSRGEAVSDAVQARLNGDLTGSFAQYFSNIDFSKFRPGVDPAQLLRMLTWMTEGYMNEKQRAGVPLRLEDILADYSGWEEMFRKIAYKEEYL